MTGPVALEKGPQRRVQDGSTNVYSSSRRETRFSASQQSSASGAHVKPIDGRTDNNETSSPNGLHQENGQNGKTPDVGSVVSKAKRAAQSLWLIIHAQNCRFGGDKCPHSGCTEAKKVLLHLKTCPANPGRECPSRYNGCYQSRKLLEHYQKCRELRAKQAGMGRRGKEAHICLVCSLVARQARSLLEGGRPMFGKKTKSNRKQVIASFTLKQNGVDKSIMSDGMEPPRHRTTPISISTSDSHSLLSSSSSDEESKRVESPPSRNHLMLFSEVAAAAAPPAMVKRSEPEALSKSLDSSGSTFLTFAANALHSLKKAAPATNGRRLRAESYDERSSTLQAKARVMEEHRQQQHQEEMGNDPTLEFQLRRPRAGSESLVEEEGKALIRRERSASLGVLANLCMDARKGATCDTIAEEGCSQEFREQQPQLQQQQQQNEEEIFEMDEDNA